MVAMADFSHFLNPQSEIFTAQTANAQAWMQETYDNVSVSFTLPDDQLNALECMRAVHEKGFTVDTFTGPGR